MPLAFTLADYQAVVCRFADKLPGLLAQSPATADLALEVDRLHIAGALDRRFSLAVVGQMRAGKSTLINALIGRDLAPVGVIETTATVNWFRYGEGANTTSFRVHYRDGSELELPLDQIAPWLHAGGEVARTNWIDFFASTEFLRAINLVDTPGTRSVLDTHEAAVQGFVLPEAHQEVEKRTRAEGSRADAVLYVVNPVARAEDRQLLMDFDADTRMPGSSVHNSVAAVQKWEHLGLDDWRTADPLATVRRLCAHMQMQLTDKVCAVLPVSGLLARCAVRTPATTWTCLAQLATRASDTQFDLLSADEGLFGDDDAELADLDAGPAERLAWLAQLPWPALRFALCEARRLRLVDGAALANHIWQSSGMLALAQLLHERIFRQSVLIQANTVLRRAWRPCEVALGRLANHDETCAAEQRKCQSVQGRVQLLQDAPLRADLRELVEARLHAVVEERNRAKTLRAELDGLLQEARDNFEALEGDLRTIGLALVAQTLPASDRALVLQVCGFGGHEVHQRLGLPADAPKRAPVAAAERLLAWAQGRSGPGAANAVIFQHVDKRLGQMLDRLDVG